MHVYASFMYLNPGVGDRRKSGATDSYKQLCGDLGLNLGPLEEHPL